MEEQSNQTLTSTLEESAKKIRADYVAKLSEILTGCGVPERFKAARLTDFTFTLPESKSGYFITGPVGCGKTHLMAAILASYFSKAPVIKYTRGPDDWFLDVEKRTAMFISEYELFGKFRSCYSNESDEAAVLRMFSKVGLLAIDDFGTEPAREWVTNKIFSVLDKRYGNPGGVVLISSNLSLQKISDTLDDRVASRIVEMCLTVDMSGTADRRMWKKKQFKTKKETPQ